MKVIAAADSINVDIPTRDQLVTSVGRLEAARLVQARDGRVRATRAGRRLVRQSGRRRDGIRSVTPRVEEALRRDVPFPREPSAWVLSEDDWRRAYEDYAGRQAKRT
jgi:hypothetical protein